MGRAKNSRRSLRKYGKDRHNPAKAGKRKRYCPQWPYCIHARKTKMAKNVKTAKVA